MNSEELADEEVLKSEEEFYALIYETFEEHFRNIFGQDE